MTVHVFKNADFTNAPVEGQMAAITLDCFCDTCGRQITMDELQTDYHQGHRFSAIEMAALQAMRAYLRFYDPTLGRFELPNS